MKKDKTLLVLVSILILGGIMGLVKAFVPGMEHFDYRYLITGTSTYGTMEKPLYAMIYGVIMAILEIGCIIIFFCYSKTALKFVITVVMINSIGCFIAIILGDYLAILSLLIRIVFLWYTNQVYKRIKNKS